MSRVAQSIQTTSTASRTQLFRSWHYLHGVGGEPAIRLDFICLADSASVRLDQSGNPGRVHDLYSLRDLAGPVRRIHHRSHWPALDGHGGRRGHVPCVVYQLAGHRPLDVLPRRRGLWDLRGHALKWFPDKRGLCGGLTAAGFGGGSQYDGWSKRAESGSGNQGRRMRNLAELGSAKRQGIALCRP